MIRNRNFPRLAVFVALLGSAFAVPATAACDEVQGDLGVWVDPNGLLSGYGMVDGTPVFGIVQYDPGTAVGSMELVAGTATISADATVVSFNETLYLYAFDWTFPVSLSFSYGDLRFEGPAGWMAGETIPPSLEAADLSWGYFSFSLGTGNSEFWIRLSQWEESSVCES